MRQSLLRSVTGIKTYDRSLVLSATGIAKWDNYYKVRRNSHSQNSTASVEQNNQKMSNENEHPLLSLTDNNKIKISQFRESCSKTNTRVKIK